MGIRLLFMNNLVKLMPPTRWYRIKAYLYWLGGVQIDPSCRVVSSANIIGTMKLRLGTDTFIGEQALIVGGESTIDIGDNVDIAPRVVIVSGTHLIDMIGPHSAGKGVSLDITIEDGVWIGANATIIGGVTIGRKAIIGAGSVVNNDIPPYVMAAGNPCRPLKIWNREEGNWQDLLST